MVDISVVTVGVLHNIVNCSKMKLKIVFYWNQLEEMFFFFFVSQKRALKYCIDELKLWLCVCVCVLSWGSLLQVMRSSVNWTLNQTLCCSLSVWSLVNHPGSLCATNYRHPSLNRNFVYHWLREIHYMHKILLRSFKKSN